jgi:hypothetical protein
VCAREREILKEFTKDNKKNVFCSNETFGETVNRLECSKSKANANSTNHLQQTSIIHIYDLNCHIYTYISKRGWKPAACSLYVALKNFLCPVT